MTAVNDLATRKILITGMSGLIGRAVRKQLKHMYEPSALNHRRGEAAFWHEDPHWEDHLNYNVIGTFNVFEPLRQDRGDRTTDCEQTTSSISQQKS